MDITLHFNFIGNIMKKKEKQNSTQKTRRFYDLYKRNESDALTKELALYFASASGKFSSKLTKLVVDDDIPGLLACNIPYDNYSPSDVRDVQYARQVLSLYAKNADLRIDGVNKSRNCLMGFVTAELQCRATNQRLFTIMTSHEWLFTREKSVIEWVSRKIMSILGDLPELSSLPLQFGPGSAATGVGTTIKNLREKLDVDPVCSSSLYRSPLINEVIAEMPMYFTYHHPNSIRISSGIYGEVPKNAKTLRTTETQPQLNMPIQKAYGGWIRRRLRAFDCDLNSQSLNQELALLGSATGEVATVDVKNASNTVAIMAVYYALQYSVDWFDTLWALRSDRLEIHGHSYAPEAFSSMGNGFTFELESLIFYAIAIYATTVANGDTGYVSVYGDDIIVPTCAYKDLLSTLKLFGFVVNEEKTFASGPFRESCGKDYFFGQNVRPFYSKDRWTDARIVGLLNHDFRHYNLIDSTFRNYLVSKLEPTNIFYGPDGYGDGHLITDASYTEISNMRSFGNQHFVELPSGTDVDPFWYHNSDRKSRRKYDKHSKSGWIFSTYVKTPLQDENVYALGDQLYAFYQQSALPTIPYCSPTLAEFHFHQFFDEGVSAVHNIGPVRENHDPYVVRGGWKAKATNVYIL